ncbi:MAG TPA: triose-phosphate isomerase, partial [Pirellulaceae bacterium]
MRRSLFAGNWKMNLHHEEALALARQVVDASPSFGDADVVICPPTIHLRSIHEIVMGTPIVLGAQNVYFEPNGAYTGETSLSMLVDAGCQMVIVGHSERRWILGETDADVRRKVRATVGRDLTPIVCLGELLEHREADRTLHVIEEQ